MALSGEPTLQVFYEHLNRNARPADAPRLSVLLHGLPVRFFETFGSPVQAVA
ncbi:hypothetical protein [Ktedonospora formicarum]|uniref:Uncharacterized protein n=1 Tax=Ktedonospora formicarum TaxID=2778364 RepID=A0A8J3ICC5_9CHLR|nr:hypothetical protein [Ktedonospora formicarum]GHO51368.1 hypothetical protein KSX_95310 [Ktedonospora formicarum]